MKDFLYRETLIGKIHYVDIYAQWARIFIFVNKPQNFLSKVPTFNSNLGN